MSEYVCKAALEYISRQEVKVLGFGSGSTVAPLAEMLTAMPSSVKAVPTSQQSLQLILQNCPERYQPLELTSEVDVTIDGADIVDLKRQIIIKGGGAAHVQEKIVAQATRRDYVIVISDSKKMKSE